MNATIFGLLAETSVHPGAGQSTGFVDLPVAREKATDYPVIVGTSVKGALRERARDKHGSDSEVIDKVFGRQEEAGAVLVSDARLLLLPVRSLTTSFKWVTCPHLLERFVRDANRAGATFPIALPRPNDGGWLGAGTGQLFLEEREFAHAGTLPSSLLELVSPLVKHEITRSRLAERLVVLSDGDFSWFARFGLAVNARNQLDEKTKESCNLWYEETLPPDSLFYMLLGERNEGAIQAVRELFKTTPYLQMGGNETVGQGWFAVQEMDR